MAAGDAYVKGPEAVADGAFFDLVPGAGVELVIHNIYVEPGKAVEFYRHHTTGPVSVKFDEDVADGSRYNQDYHCTSASYIRVKNVSGASINIGADGMTTK